MKSISKILLMILDIFFVYLTYLQIIERKAHSFRGGMDSTFFYNLICMVLLISYIYYFIIYVWKIIIDTQPYLR